MTYSDIICNIYKNLIERERDGLTGCGGATCEGAATKGPMSLMSVSFLPSCIMVVTVPWGIWPAPAAPAAGTGDLVPLREIVGAGEGVELIEG